MKHLLLLIFTLITLLFSCKHYDRREVKTSIGKVDTLALGEFIHNKIVRYSISNAKICISTKEFLDDIEVFHQRYKNLLLSSNKRRLYSDHDKITRLFRFIDSVYQIIQFEMNTKDTIDISQKLFTNHGLGCLVKFENFIENNKCAIYDENGIRQYKIIRKNESYIAGPLDAWAGRRYYLMSNELYFYEVTDMVS